jgi:4'-phosphopantetheinyl transferase
MYGSVNCSFTDSPGWQTQPTVPVKPQANTFYIWQASTIDLYSFYDQFNALLNNDERAKSLRYYQPADRQRYILQHGLLRLLLGWYLHQPATGIRFNFNANKKPYLTGNHQPCFFNISHSGPEMLIAIGDVELGVDIEQINHQFEYQDIASQYFSTAEVNFINESADSPAAFFLLWTRKEALLKACGTGIDDNLPDMPALNGLHQLPAAYQNINWLTESFNAYHNCIASLTYSQPALQINRGLISGDFVSSLLMDN